MRNLEKKELFCGVSLTDSFTAAATMESIITKERIVVNDNDAIGLVGKGNTVILSSGAALSSFQFTHVLFQ
jgi:hypothetical protein